MQSKIGEMIKTRFKSNTLTKSALVKGPNLMTSQQIPKQDDHIQTKSKMVAAKCPEPLHARKKNTLTANDDSPATPEQTPST